MCLLLLLLLTADGSRHTRVSDATCSMSYCCAWKRWQRYWWNLLPSF